MDLKKKKMKRRRRKRKMRMVSFFMMLNVLCDKFLKKLFFTLFVFLFEKFVFCFEDKI